MEAESTLHDSKTPMPYITKLQIVQLYAADFNSVWKYVLIKKMMTHDREHVNVNDQLYAQKYKSTYDALITTMYDMARV